jgi:hypothetical protein
MSTDKKHLLLSVYAYGSLIFLFVSLAVVSFLMLYPYKTIKVNDIDLVSYEVKQGDKLGIVLDYDRYTDTDSTVVRRFKDGLIFTTPTMTGVGKVGHYNRLVEVEIPANLPPGKYTLETDITHKVNPIRSITTSWETPQFTVIRNIDGAYGATPTKSNLGE